MKGTTKFLTRMKWRKLGPIALAVAGSLGVVGTAFLAAKARPEADRQLLRAENEKGEELTPVETVEAAVPAYIWPIVAGTATIGCVIGSAVMGQKNYAAVVGAYGLIADQYHTYREKNIKLHGVGQDREVINAITLSECEDVPISCSTFAQVCENTVGTSEIPEVVRTFYDPFSNRYFESTVARVIDAEYHLNRNLALCGLVPLNEFYELLGLDPIPEGDYTGWNVCDELYWIDFDHKVAKLDDGMEVMTIDMAWEPRANFEEDI